ncbi:MAG: PadR family transcriptional regulator [Lachnospiraceae bacterium]|nr:PadR family transcriptional regulator [Lachnospiraceae bacterium]
MDIQLRKGLLEYCVLAILRDRDSYGYQMIRDISECIEISESTLYPILRRLESAGKVTSYNTEYNNRIRKYFHLTDDGRQMLSDFKSDREQMIKVLDFISKGEKNDEESIL